MNKKDKLSIIHILFLLMYGFIIVVHVFFPRSGLNIEMSSKIFLAQFYSFPMLFGGLIATFSLVIIFIGILRFKGEYRKKSRFKFLIGILICSLIFAMGGSDFKKQVNISNQKDTIKIVEWNTLDNFDEKHIIKIFKEYNADIAIFPELGGYEKGDISNQRLKDLFKKANVDFDNYEVFLSTETEGSIAPVTVITKKEFSDYNKIEENYMTRFGTVFLESKNGNGLDVVGLHTAPPLPTLMSQWKRDLELISDKIAREYTDAIIVGDFNATTRHGAMNLIDTHEDALEYVSKLNGGTWNIKLPSYFRTNIDHILIPKGIYGVKDVNMIDFPESDHACVFVEIFKK